MQKTIILIISSMIIIVLGSCGISSKDIMLKAQSDRTDVFREVLDDEKPPKGFSDLIIKVPVKTHLEGYHVFPEKSLHGDPLYPFVLNIDGQGVLWEIKGHVEKTPFFDKKGEIDPEGGEGMRYILDKKIRLTTALHNIFFGLPGDNYGVNFQITLKKDRHLLECKPVYKLEHPETRESKPGMKIEGMRNVRSFKHGISKCKLFSDGDRIK